MRLSGKDAVITGGGSGMGRAIALEFARQGAQVVVAHINEAAAEETAGLVRAEQGIAFGRRVVVAESKSVDSLQRAPEMLGADYFLGHCAGVRSSENFRAHTGADGKRMLDISFDVPFYSLGAVRPAILATSGGKVINIASIAGARLRLLPTE